MSSAATVFRISSATAGRGTATVAEGRCQKRWGRPGIRRRCYMQQVHLDPSRSLISMYAKDWPLVTIQIVSAIELVMYNAGQKLNIGFCDCHTPTTDFCGDTHADLNISFNTLSKAGLDLE